MSPIRPATGTISAIAQEMLSSVAVAALAAHFDDGPRSGEAGLGRGLADAFGQTVVVDMDGLPASVADQEDAVVQAFGMLVGDISIGAFDPPGEIGADEEVEDPVHAVCRNAPAFGLRDGF